MYGSISGCLTDAVTGEILLSPTLSLSRRGVLGETFLKVDEQGRFVFGSLPAGSYCLGTHDDRYAPIYRRLALEENKTIENLTISLTPGAFLKGRILDRDGYPPSRCHFTLIRSGNRGEQSGYISDSGDHEVGEDGLFTSSPLHPGTYFLRFSGILRKPPETDSCHPAERAMQKRTFDFLYPNALDVEAAHPFDLRSGQTLTDQNIRIPHPIWRTVRGRLTGVLPEDFENIYVHFIRDVGMLDDFGGCGPPVEADGTFEGQAQPGQHRLSVWQMTPSQSEGRHQVTKALGSVEITVGDHDLGEVEIPISS